MNVFDLVYYLLDAVLLGMLIGWLKNSLEVKIETKVGMKWLVSGIFLAMALVCAFYYEGFFRYVQAAVLMLAALLYYMQKSGLSEKGIVNMGALIRYEKAGKVSVNKAESSISFRYGRNTAILYFDPEQMAEVRAFLEAKKKQMKP